MPRFTVVGLFSVLLSTVVAGGADPSPGLQLKPDLQVPNIESTTPAAGKRVRAVTSGWEQTEVHHTLYLPQNWQANKRYPVLVEYPGNGPYRSPQGDFSSGEVEDCLLGYGLSAGEGYLWVCLPCIEITAQGKKQNCREWWGEIEETKRYCLATVQEVCDQYGGDADQFVLCGFSRGAIACNYIGLHDDRIAALWKAFFIHSHYDGVREWKYPHSNAASALKRLQRLQGRPQWISHETSVAETQRYLASSGIQAPFEFVALPFPNHTAAWVLCDLPERKRARDWLTRTLESPVSTK